ncbi:hypothetical protein LTSEINV_6554 [Salmonella enterica subsp. enterica serovar Inverness str. R8-3668]|uniref:Uncharacterized protein n=1 Tax=Salmonella enterica subsp. enterica serovar Inverness str. R8-3668 TaxID=913075 RepID=G5NMA3_SALET|nr:hypothetical protein LTSEINV_6554 [Salmonella enterica subsp. enterica serovar Inverness str. R8-3668]
MKDTMEESLLCLEAALGEMDEATRTLALNTIRRRLTSACPESVYPQTSACPESVSQ